MAEPQITLWQVYTRLDEKLDQMGDKLADHAQRIQVLEDARADTATRAHTRRRGLEGVIGGVIGAVIGSLSDRFLGR